MNSTDVQMMITTLIIPASILVGIAIGLALKSILTTTNTSVEVIV